MSSFERPKTIMAALQAIDQYDYALPALQREFVWKPQQIYCLFDSLMKGYPIGSFLLWQLEPETARKFRFYQFMRDYHEWSNRHCAEYPMNTQVPKVAVLDGQQRLTAFNIALYGSFAWKKKYKRRNNPDAYPVRHLCLNLLSQAPPNDDDIVHDFRFLTEDEQQQRDKDHYWFPVSKVRKFDEPIDLAVHLQEQDLGPRATKSAGRLQKVLMVEPLINYYLETDQDLDKVLNIFIRVNSGGTPLSYSDLLLSIATTQWKEIDARQEVHGLVDILNKHGLEDGFRFSKDFVLKAGLMLADLPSLKFRARNFTHENMARIEDNWWDIADALKLTAKLLEDFGLSGRHLSSQNSVLPLAYYVYKQGFGGELLDRKEYQQDRENMRTWLLQTTLAGVWSGGNVDSLLDRIREKLQDTNKFPHNELFAVIRQEGRDPYLDEDSIDELLEVTYNDRRAFMLLSLIYDFVRLDTEHFHVDHIYPRTLMRKSKLVSKGFDDETAEQIEDRANRLPNLWLLQGTENLEKSKKLPREWIELQYEDEASRMALYERYHLQDLGDIELDFEDFYEARHARLKPVLLGMLGRVPN